MDREGTTPGRQAARSGPTAARLCLTSVSVSVSVSVGIPRVGPSCGPRAALVRPSCGPRAALLWPYAQELTRFSRCALALPRPCVGLLSTCAERPAGPRRARDRERDARSASAPPCRRCPTARQGDRAAGARPSPSSRRQPRRSGPSRSRRQATACADARPSPATSSRVPSPILETSCGTVGSESDHGPTTRGGAST